MKLRARFPQILVGGRPAANDASGVVQRSAFWPTTRSHEETLGAPPLDAATAAATAAAPAAAIAPARRARVERPRTGWMSTVAAWRSTAGLGGEERG